MRLNLQLHHHYSSWSDESLMFKLPVRLPSHKKKGRIAEEKLCIVGYYRGVVRDEMALSKLYLFFFIFYIRVLFYLWSFNSLRANSWIILTTLKPWAMGGVFLVT